MACVGKHSHLKCRVIPDKHSPQTTLRKGKAGDLAHGSVSGLL